jgi:uncharacterized protein (UPF0332 family)
MTQELTMAEWRRSDRALRAAETLLNAGLPADSVSRAYYATLHAARAALSVRTSMPRTHGGVRRLFGSELVSTGEIEPEWAKILAHLQDRREDADYDVSAEMSEELAKEIVEQARRFRRRMEQFLAKAGFDL